jgi:hypothetical protein
LDYHANTKSALLNGASYLLKPIVLTALKNEIKIDLSEAEKDLIAKSQTELPKLTSELPDGLNLALEPSSARLGDIIIGNNQLLVLVNVKGRVDISVNESFLIK